MALKPARLQWLDDGVPVSLDFGDIYFQPGQGIAETDYVFLQGNRLQERFRAPPGGVFRVAELGFGTGLNFLRTATLWNKTAPRDARLVYVSMEKHPLLKEDIARLYAGWARDLPEMEPFTAGILAQYPPLTDGFHHLFFSHARIHLMLMLGDAAQTLPELGGRFDAWYLDGFAPAKNPGMWEEKLFSLIAARTMPEGTLSTFSAAGHVRRGLEAAGFAVEKIKGFGDKRDMTIARLPSSAPASAPNMPKKAFVLGAGLAGCSAARALAEKGCRVTVIERHAACAAETSGNPSGILYPKLTVDSSPHGMFHGHGFCYTRALLQSLQLPSWHACGVLHLDLGAEDRERSEKLIRKNGYPSDYARTVEETSDICGLDLKHTGLYHAMAGFLSPPEFCAALLNHENIETFYTTQARSLSSTEGPLIVALGNNALSFPGMAELPLRPLRGQISYLEATASTRALKTVVCHDGHITPARNGVHYCGSTFQKEPVSEAIVRGEDDAENLHKLHQNIPALHDATRIIGSRAGYRATTPDRLPLAGTYDENVYICAGFGAHGLSGAPLAGEIIACLITGDPLPVPLSLLSYLDPRRFTGNAHKKSGP